MKALVYEKAHILDSFSIQLVDVAEPTLRDSDVLVRTSRSRQRMCLGCGEALRTYEQISVTRSDCPSAAAGAPSRPLPQHL